MTGQLPRHIAIIMDGNGRWARRRALPRIEGHRAGVAAVREVVESCGELGIQCLTLFAFSTENWKRPRGEVTALMQLLVRHINRELPRLKENGVRVKVIGRLEEMPRSTREAMQKAVAATRDEQGLTLVLALNYGARREIVDAARRLAIKVRDGGLAPEDIDEESFAAELYTAGLPELDLVIRPSGELRVSNFLLWQLAYAEIWVTDLLWPDFRREHLLQAIGDFQARERRFGGLKDED